jgi:LysM repeat protein
MKHRFTTFCLVVWVLLAMTMPVFGQQQAVHTVQAGENLFRIALRYGVGMDAIIRANGITDPRRIFAGQQLIIPSFDPSPAVVENPTVAIEPSYHVVQRGETLASIAARYGITVEQLLQSNNIPNPNRILPGDQLVVWGMPASTETAPADTAPAETVPVSAPAAADSSYTVQRGEHLSQIARRFGLEWPVLAQANGITDPNRIYAGQTLIIPGGAGRTVSTDANMGGQVDLSGYAAAVGYTPASPTIFSGRQVVVDLSDSRVYAYQDGVLVRDVLVSTGLPATPTVVGDFKVYTKYESQAMSGPGYYLPGVPYVMYFYQGYALHGTYWHSNWGRPMSRGCVNMPTEEAMWFFYNFVDIGTPVRVQY